MAVSECLFCREMVVTSNGYFVQHSRLRDSLRELCLGSGLPVFCVRDSMDCC